MFLTDVTNENSYAVMTHVDVAGAAVLLCCDVLMMILIDVFCMADQIVGPAHMTASTLDHVNDPKEGGVPALFMR